MRDALHSFPPMPRAVCIAAAAVMLASPSFAEQVPGRLLGVWSRDCANPNAAHLILEPAIVSIAAGSRRQSFTGLEVSRTWIGGARASGDRLWLLVSSVPGAPFDFVLAPSNSNPPFLELEEGPPDHGQAVRKLFGETFLYCGNGARPSGEGQRAPQLAAAMSGGSGDKGRRLDVPVLEHGGDGQAANCMSSVVAGLKAGGDGFLAVRSGPGSQYKKIDELYNGEKVVIFDMRGKWAGIVYRTAKVTCSSRKTVPVPYERKGWVHTDWLKHLAG